MVLGRGRLAKIDRRVFSELSHSASVQAVKVPVSEAVWSTWRRYCEALGISMGSGVAGPIFDELETVLDAAKVGAEGMEAAAPDAARDQRPGPGPCQGGPQRTVSLRLGSEIQTLPRTTRTLGTVC